MQQFRLIVPALALAAAVAATSMAGRAEQQAPAAGVNPFDQLYFRSIGPATM